MSKEKKSIIVFLVITGLLSCICYAIAILGGESASSITAVLMWCPGIAALVVKKIYYRKERVFGFGKCQSSYIALAIVLPVIYLGLSYGIYWLINPSSFTGEVYSNSMPLMVSAFFTSMLTAMGEEIGWRGFLLPKMESVFNYKTAILLSGVIWAIWHFPLMITGQYQSGTPIYYQLPMFTLDIVLITAIMAYIRLKSNNIWPAIILHSSHNYFDQLIFQPLTDSPQSVYLVGETGLITIICILMIVIFFYIKRKNGDINKMRATQD